jgi:hypothetical protein
MASEGSDRAITIVFFLICVEGLMGGAAYCMTFYHVGREGDEEPNERKRKVQKAFRMGACGSADSFGESPKLPETKSPINKSSTIRSSYRCPAGQPDLHAGRSVAVQRSSETR